MSSRKPDIQKRLAKHNEAKAKAHAWAVKGLELVKAGKIRQARAAELKAQKYLDEAWTIEGFYQKPKPR